MANDTNYWGLRPVKHICGSPWNGLTEKCYVDNTSAAALYIGQPVAINATAADCDDTCLYTSVEAATLTAAYYIYGVITSFDSTIDMDDKYVKKPASTESWINVCTDPTVIYHIRDDGEGTVDNTWPSLNAGLTAAAADSAITGLSGVGLDGSTPATTRNLQLHIVRLANLPDNAMSDNAVWEVLLNTSYMRGGAAETAVVGTFTGIA